MDALRLKGSHAIRLHRIASGEYSQECCHDVGAGGIRVRSVMGYVGTYVTKRSGHIRTPKCSNFFSFTDTAAGRTRMHIGWREGEIFLDIEILITSFIRRPKESYKGFVLVRHGLQPQILVLLE